MQAHSQGGGGGNASKLYQEPQKLAKIWVFVRGIRERLKKFTLWVQNAHFWNPTSPKKSTLATNLTRLIYDDTNRTTMFTEGK